MQSEKCKLKESGEQCILSDGEAALINACEVVFNQYTMLRCARHFEVNCRKFLKKLEISWSLKEVSTK